MKGYGTGLLKLTLKTTETRGLKRIVDYAYFLCKGKEILFKFIIPFS